MILKWQNSCTRHALPSCMDGCSLMQFKHFEHKPLPSTSYCVYPVALIKETNKNVVRGIPQICRFSKHANFLFSQIPPSLSSSSAMTLIKGHPNTLLQARLIFCMQTKVTGDVDLNHLSTSDSFPTSYIFGYDNMYSGSMYILPSCISVGICQHHFGHWNNYPHHSPCPH